MSPAERIEKAAEALVRTIKDSGYHIDDVPVEQLGQGQIELFRYPPQEYHTAICAVPDTPEAQTPAELPPPAGCAEPAAGNPNLHTSAGRYTP